MKMPKIPKNPEAELTINYKEEVTPIESIVYTDDEGDRLEFSLDKKALKIKLSVEFDDLNFWVEKDAIEPLLEALNKMVKLG